MISYNGYEFSDYHNVEIELQPVYAPDDRTVIYKKLVVTIKDIVAPRIDTTDPDKKNTADMEAVKLQLRDPGKTLIISDAGFGLDLEINGSSGLRDIASGPKPRVLRWMPVGHERAANITWTVEAHLSPCDETFEGIVSLTYGVAFAINEKGYTTRTVQGLIIVAQSQINGESTASADDFRERINVLTLPNAKRSQSFNLSPNKAELSFSITDREIESPNGFPNDVVSISAPIQSRFKWPDRSATKTQSVLTVTLELQAEAARVRALQIFSAILAHRFGLFEQENQTYFLREMTISEDLFSHRYSFSALVAAVLPLNVQLRLLRYFSPISEDWAAWSNSTSNTKGVRGLSGIAHPRTEDNDELVSLCTEQSGLGLTVDNETDIKFPADISTSVLCNPLPSPENSWVEYDAHLIEATAYQRSYNTTYGSADIQQVEFDPLATSESEPFNRIDSSGYEVSFSDAPPEQKWIWKGFAQRIGYPIPPLGKITIGGREATVVGQPLFKTRLVGVSFCQPVYEAVWNVGLILTDTPDVIEDSETDQAATIRQETAGEA